MKNIINFDKNPLYLKFMNHPNNEVPNFLLNRKEIAVLLQKQFENLTIDTRYLSVTIYFDGKPANIVIDLSTIFFIDINKMTISLDYRTTNDYLNSIKYTDSEQYYENMRNIATALTMHNKNIVKITLRDAISSEEHRFKAINFESLLGKTEYTDEKK